jgi:putative membrane protein
MDAAIAYLHFISMMLIAATLLTEFMLCTKDLQPPHIRTLALVDLLYLLAAIAALATGLLRVFVFGKGLQFYLSNPVFHIKVSLFVAVGLISIVPTLQFLRWNRALKAGQERILRDAEIVSARRYVGLELLLLLCIPLAAVLMARGVGAPQ